MDKLSFIDLFSPLPGLKINNGEKYYTYFGLIVSFFTILSILGTVFYYFIYSISFSSYQILERIDNDLEPRNEIFKNKISFTLVDPLGKIFPDQDRLFEIDAKFWQMDKDTGKGQIPKVSNVPMTNCSIYENGAFEKDFRLLTLNYPTAKCLDFSDFRKDLFGKYGSLKG